jgi:hypothetical protein
MPVFHDVLELAIFQAPWGREVRLQQARLEGGMTILRVRIREGSRFTDLELTAEKAVEIGEAVSAWGRQQNRGA